MDLFIISTFQITHSKSSCVPYFFHPIMWNIIVTFNWTSLKFKHVLTSLIFKNSVWSSFVSTFIQKLFIQISVWALFEYIRKLMKFYRVMTFLLKGHTFYFISRVLLTLEPDYWQWWPTRHHGTLIFGVPTCGWLHM